MYRLHSSVHCRLAYHNNSKSTYFLLKFVMQRDLDIICIKIKENCVLFGLKFLKMLHIATTKQSLFSRTFSNSKIPLNSSIFSDWFFWISWWRCKCLMCCNDLCIFVFRISGDRVYSFQDRFLTLIISVCPPTITYTPTSRQVITDSQNICKYCKWIYVYIHIYDDI